MPPPLILLFGMPRSGTTWIGKIFDSHPDTLYRHEPDSRGALKTIPLVTAVADSEQYRSAITGFVTGLPRVNTPRAAASLPMFPKRYQSAVQLCIKKASVFATKAAEPLIRDLPVIDFVRYDKIVDLRVVWKSIESLGRLGVILRVAPDSRAVHILRHPCGYVASVLSGETTRHFSSKTASSEDYPVYEMLLAVSSDKKRNPSLEDLKLMEPVERLAWRWVLFNEIALAGSKGFESCTVLRYEDLCAEPLGKARALLRFAGLDWHSQVEHFIRRSTASNSDHYYSVFKDPADSSTKWQHELPASQIDAIIKVVRQSSLHNHYPDNRGLPNA
jgi:hypothetical protein